MFSVSVKTGYFNKITSPQAQIPRSLTKLQNEYREHNSRVVRTLIKDNLKTENIT